MNTSTHPAEMPATNLSRRVLSKDDIDCDVIALAPSEQIPCLDAHWTQEHILFVIDGVVSVQVGDLTQFVSRDEALHIPPGKNSTITAGPSGWTKLLRVDFTRRTIVEPPIFSVPPFAAGVQP